MEFIMTPLFWITMCFDVPRRCILFTQYCLLTLEINQQGPSLNEYARGFSQVIDPEISEQVTFKVKNCIIPEIQIPTDLIK